MWNVVRVCGVECCVQSTFIVPNHISFLNTKVYTTQHNLFGKVFVVNYSIKLKVMTLLWVDYTAELQHNHNVNVMWGVYFAIIFVIAFLTRKTPLGFLWKIIVGFFIVLLVTLFADKFKNDLKSWWNK
jgi:hypothetical protein